MTTRTTERQLIASRAAGDAEAAALAERILAEERAAAQTLPSNFDVAVRASLEAVGAAS